MPIGGKRAEPAPIQEVTERKITRGPDALKGAVLHVQRLHMPVPDAPQFAQQSSTALQLPDDITRLNMDLLGKLYGQFMAMAAYAEPQVAVADVEHTETRHALAYAEAQAGLASEGGNKDERKWSLMVDPGYQKMLADERTAYAKFTLLKHLLRRYEKSAAALSRELARRGVEIESKL